MKMRNLETYKSVLNVQLTDTHSTLYQGNSAQSNDAKKRQRLKFTWPRHKVSIQLSERFQDEHKPIRLEKTSWMNFPKSKAEQDRDANITLNILNVAFSNVTCTPHKDVVNK